MADGSREVTLGEAILYFKEDVTEFMLCLGRKVSLCELQGWGKDGADEVIFIFFVLIY